MFLAISSAVLIVSVLFISSPAIVYFRSDASDFPLPLSAYLGIFLVLSVISILIVGLAFRLARRGWKTQLASALAFLAIMTCVEVFVLMPEFGTFSGASIDWKISVSRFVLEACAVVFTILVVREWAKSPKVPSVIFLIISCFISVSPIWGAITEKKPVPKKIDEGTLFGLGEKNLMVVLLDGFPSDVFEEILETHVDWKNSFAGFTYYPDTVGVSRTTFLALPSIHSGKVYSPGMALQPFFSQSIKNDSFMGLLSDAGFSSILVNPINKACPRATDCLPGVMVLSDNRDLQISGVARLIGLSLFRAAPLALKEQVYDDGRWLFTRLVSNPRSVDHNAEGIDILNAFAEKLSPQGTKPTAKFLHLLTPHLPVVFGAGCRHSAVPIPATKEAFITQSECSLAAFVSVINSMKERGTYDNTAIILLSDHGQGYPNRKSDGEGEWANLSGAANPLLVIKPFGANGQMKVSSEPRWLPEIPSIVCELTDTCKPTIMHVNSGRIFNFYEWKNEYWQAGEIPVTQYSVSGEPWKSSSWSVLREKSD